MVLEAATGYPQVPVEQLPDDLRLDITWITPWIREEYTDDSTRVSWYRFGRDSDSAPVFSQLILLDGNRVGWQEGRRLVDEHQMGVLILRHFGIESDQPAVSLTVK
ncbi:MAG TPA: hypothetical protein VIH90_03070 [Candidatus Saccharimonadales bacterium]